MSLTQYPLSAVSYLDTMDQNMKIKEFKKTLTLTLTKLMLIMAINQQSAKGRHMTLVKCLYKNKDYLLKVCLVAK